jgi:peptide-methionine (S)-S-oxide reductase
MSTPRPARKRLPARPSEENLKKQAKSRAKREHVRLSTAQHQLAREYGFASWPKLVQHVRSIVNEGGTTKPASQNIASTAKILRAAVAADAKTLKQLLVDRVTTDLRDEKGNSPFILVCKSDARPQNRVAAAKVMVDAGVPVREFGENGTCALHWAAKLGPIAMVELLIRSGIPAWLEDDNNRQPLDYARSGDAPDREQIIELLDRPVIRDPAFRAAVVAIQSGDLRSLRKLLAAHPNLAHDRAVEPDCYPQDYFRDPKLLWFVADNPNLIATIPANTIQIAEAIIDAGAEQSDLEYTLALVMTSAPAREQGFQRPLIKLLISRGARIKDNSFLSSLGHGERDAVAAVLETGIPVSATVAAGMGRLDDLARLLKSATNEQKHAALSVAVVNRELQAARLCLEAGADVNRFAAVHMHSMPIHQAVVNGDVPMMKLLVEHGARLDARDTLWNGTPLGWAIHTNQPAAEAYLRSLLPPDGQ